MNKDLIAIFDYMEREKGIKREIILSAIEESLQAAAEKSVETVANVSVNIDSRTGSIEVLCEKEIVEEVTEPSTQISVEAAKEIDPDCEVGQFIDLIVTPDNFGRIAAQKAKQIITQRLRGAERDVIYSEYRNRVGELISGSVKRMVRGATCIVDLGKVDGIMPMRHYPKTETYNVGDRVLALLLEVQDTDNGGAEVIISRSHPEFVRQLFLQEVPEMADQTIEIERIVRDAGYRTKLTVRSNDDRVDPVGACVGVRGVRVKNVIRELNNEKIDIIPHTNDPVDLLQGALDPIEIRKISVNEDDSVMSIIVDDDDFAIVIGRKGMNARLNGQLIGYELEVQKMSDYIRMLELEKMELIESNEPWLDEKLKALGPINPLIVENLISEGFDNPRQILTASREDLAGVPGVSLEMADRIVEEIKKQRT